MMHCLNLIKGSAQREIDNTLTIIHDDHSPKQRVTQSALTQARKKLSHTAFVELNQQVVEKFYEQPHTKTWQGFRLCAIDGSKLRLPQEAEVIEEFGLHTGRLSQRDVPMALASLYYDVLNQLVIDAGIYPSNTPERSCVQHHLEQAQKNDLVLLDRGYPTFWLYTLFAEKQLSFCMRAKTKLDIPIREFLRSGKAQTEIEFTPPKGGEAKCQERGLVAQPIRLRLIRVKLKTETEILITNLLDTTRFPASWFKKLYHYRWQIEEQYKRQKQWLEIENFTGKSVQSIRQDLHAKQVTHNLTAMMVHASQEQADEKNKSRLHVYKINFAQALSKMKDAVVHLLLNRDLRRRLSETVDDIATRVSAVRPGRRFPRRMSNLHHNLYWMSYKSCR